MSHSTAPVQSEDLARDLNTSPPVSSSFGAGVLVAQPDAAPANGAASEKRGKLFAVPYSSGEKADLYFHPSPPRTAWPDGLCVANVKIWHCMGVRSFELYRSPVMQPVGARAFRWLSLCKGERAKLETATRRALRVVAKNLTAYGWTVEIVEAAK